MKNRDEVVLEKILKYVEQIEDAHKDYGKSFDSFQNSSVYRNACCMCILQIGELCKLLTDEFKQNEKEVPWREWCGIRDIFAHQYGAMDIEVAWGTLIEDLPVLEEKVKESLKKINEEN